MTMGPMMIYEAPSYPPPPVLLKRHPSRSVSPIPRPPTVPRRSDKALHRTTRQRFTRSLFGKKVDKTIDTDSIGLLAPEKDLISSEDIIADLSAAESCRLVKWTTNVFSRPSFDTDDGSTSTATSSSTLSEETFTSSTPVIGTLPGSVAATEIPIFQTTDSMVTSPIASPVTVPATEQPVEMLMLDPTPAVSTRRVRFDAASPRLHQLDECIEGLTRADKESRWYSRRDIAKQRQDMKQSILRVRQDEQGADLFINDASLQPQQCATGCERYFSAENRFMGQKMIVEAIVENNGLSDEQLREISRNLSRPNRELALWHAKLNAIQCWGLRAMKKQSVAAPESKKKRSSDAVSPAPVVGAPETTPTRMQAKMYSMPRLSAIAKETSVDADLSLPSLTDESSCTDSSSDAFSFHLAPRVVPFELDESIETAFSELFGSTTNEVQVDGLDVGMTHQVSNHHFHSTVQKWREMSEDTSVSTRSSSACTSDEEASRDNHMGISCGACH